MNKNDFINANSARSFRDAVKAQNDAIKQLTTFSNSPTESSSKYCFLDPSALVTAEAFKTFLSTTKELNAVLSEQLDALAEKQEIANQILAESVQKSEEWHKEDSKAGNLALKIGIATFIATVSGILISSFISIGLPLLLD